MRAHAPVLLILASSLSLQGCKSCFAPSLPSPDLPKTDTQDDDSATDSADSGDSGPIDTTPPPPCDVPEVESNNNPNEPQALPLDQWACGIFDTTIDPEAFGFSTTQADWIRLEVRAVSIGSEADVSLNLFEPDGDISAAWTGSTYSTDPFIVFKVDKARDFVAMLSDAYYGYGEDWFWEMMVTVTKAPVEWTAEEAEPNDEDTEANALTPGTTSLGVISSSSDLDWFKVSVPDAEKHTLRVRVYAARHGSPVDLKAIVYDPSGNWAETSLTGENGYDRDPWLDVTTDEAGDWTILIRDEFAKGSPIYWYTIVTELDPEGTDETE